MARLTINGKSIDVDVDPSTPLLWAIREQAGLTGTKYGCGIALCGACTVHIDGAAVRSCVMPVTAAVGKQIKLIPVDDVVYFQSDMKYTRVVLAQSEALIRTPLKDLLAELDPDRFWQIHRSTIVNVAALSGVLREDAERQFARYAEYYQGDAFIQQPHFKRAA